MRAALAAFSLRELVALSARAAEQFVTATLPLGEADRRRPRTTCASSRPPPGLPHVMVRRNMEKIRAAMVGLRARDLGPDARPRPATLLDRGFGEVAGSAVSFIPRSPTLGVVLPSNSPGVHSLWVPAIALKTPLVLKPGSAEPWTPLPRDPGLPRGGRAGGRVRLLPDRPRGRGRDPAPLRPRHGVRRRRFDAPVAVRPARRGARPRLQQGRARPGRERRLGAPPRRDGVLDRRERRALVHQRLGGVGHGATRARSPRRWRSGWRAIEPRARPRTPTRSSRRSPIPKVAERISAMIDGELEVPGAEDVTARLRGSGRVARARRLHLPAADDRALRLARPPARQPRVPVPVRERRAGAAGGDPRAPRAHARRHGAHRRPGAASTAPGLAARGPPQPRRDADLEAQLGPAARRQPVRAPLRAARAPAGGPAWPRDACACSPSPPAPAGMYCGCCLRDNALAAELHGARPRRHAAAGLHADAHRRGRTSPTRTSSSAASASTSSSTCRSCAGRRRCSTSSGTRRP